MIIHNIGFMPVHEQRYVPEVQVCTVIGAMLHKNGQQSLSSSTHAEGNTAAHCCLLWHHWYYQKRHPHEQILSKSC